MDRYTKGFIYYWHKYLNEDQKYIQSDLNDYYDFYKIINNFKEKYCEEDITFKQLDIFMWSYGKEKGLAIEESEVMYKNK